MRHYKSCERPKTGGPCTCEKIRAEVSRRMFEKPPEKEHLEVTFGVDPDAWTHKEKGVIG